MTMDSRKESLSTLKICRFCLSQDESELTSLYDKIRAPKNAVTFQLKILSCIAVEVFPSDKMPSYICLRCKFFMDITYEFKRICRTADENMLQFIQNGTQLEPLIWPPSLKKIFQLRSKGKVPAEVNLMKTVVEGGATVQVTTQDLSDTDMEDDENVYNIKIGDGPDHDNSSTRIKVVTTDVPREKTKANKGFSSVTKLTRHVRTHAGQRSYPCKFCNKSFVKTHHYTRHLRTKHAGEYSCRDADDQFRCEQCDDTFGSQDDLIYHSAIHATQNLICPLCQEKFDDVDGVTAHIKSHGTGVEYMCDYCELIFTEKEKLDFHVASVHDKDEDIGLDESSMEMDEELEEEEEDDNTINLKEENGEMVVEINKADDFMLENKEDQEKSELVDNTNLEDVTVSEENGEVVVEIKKTEEFVLNQDKAVATENINTEESDNEATTVAEIPEKEDVVNEKPPTSPPIPTEVIKPRSQPTDKTESQTASILRKAEEVKRKAQLKTSDPPAEKKQKPNNNNKVESSTPVGASDKSLRLLEKELQDLKRTNTRSDAVKTPIKSLETSRSRRAPIHTSTPKPRSIEERKSQLAQSKLNLIEKKNQEKRALTKENKEPKELKESKETKNTSNVKDEKESKDISKDNKVVSKNGTSEKREEGPVRRSARPSKIRDYAKMIRDSSQTSDGSNEGSDKEEEDDGTESESKETDKTPETRTKQRRTSVRSAAAARKQTPPPAEPSTPTARKRGRPRKDTKVPSKIKKQEEEEIKTEEVKSNKSQETKNESVKAKNTSKVSESNKDDKISSENNEDNKSDQTDDESSKQSSNENSQAGVVVSPTTGQTLKKVPIKALPPGVKPLPLPTTPRLGSGEVCEMQIGKKIVKVQKIVMTKAEVEAMAKKGLVEMKDGTMVLKQGIKIPTADSSLKSPTTEELSKESPKKDKVTPTRFDIGDDAHKK